MNSFYAQAMHEIHHGERYWFDSEDEQIMTENNREFEQTPAMLQLFYQYFKASRKRKRKENFLPGRNTKLSEKEKAVCHCLITKYITSGDCCKNAVFLRSILIKVLFIRL